MTKRISGHAQSKSWFQAVGQSFTSALGSIVFGMEDGTVSIFGLVFGVAAGATSSKTVLLAGATGAISAAVSMMAGTYLDISTERDQAQAETARESEELKQNPAQAAREVHDRLLMAGLAPADAETVMAIIEHTPNAILKDDAACKLESGPADRNPLIQSLWMFATNLFAAFVPVLPFAFVPLARARALSLVVTSVLLLALGVGRGVIGQRNVVVTAVQTLIIAAAAGAAGLLVGSLISSRYAG